MKQETLPHIEDMQHNLSYLPQNDTYFIILSFSVQTKFMCYINNVIIFKYPPHQLKVSDSKY